MRRLNIRWKLTFWYGGVLALVLTLFSTVVYLVMRQQLLQRIDHGLREELADVLFEINRARDAAGLQVWLERRFSRHEGFDFQITRPVGERFFVNERMVGKSFPPPEALGAEPAFTSVSMEQTAAWRIVSINAAGPDGPLAVQVARSLGPFEQESATLLYTFLLTGPLTLLIAVLGGYALARRVLAPVETMTQAANRITADRLNERLSIDNSADELGALGQTLNRMIERLEQSFSQMQRFTADAAHELRTPLAVMRSEAEIALRSPRSPDDYRAILETLLEETNRLSRIADELLFLARHDAGLLRSDKEPVEISALVRDVVTNMQVVAEAKGVHLDVHGDEKMPLSGDAAQLRRVMYNLLDNAVKHTSSGGHVQVTTCSENGNVAVIVKDTGSGIALVDLPHVFERFYRADPARSGENGMGLGLAICKSLVEAHGGSIAIESDLGKGTTLTLRFARGDETRT